MSKLPMTWDQLIDYGLTAIEPKPTRQHKQVIKSNWHRFRKEIGELPSTYVDTKHFNDQQLLDYRKTWKISKGSDSSVFTRAKQLGRIVAEWQEMSPGRSGAVPVKKKLGTPPGAALFNEIKRLQKMSKSTWEETDRAAGGLKISGLVAKMSNIRWTSRASLESLENHYAVTRGSLLKLWTLPDGMRWQDTPKDVAARIRAGEISSIPQAVRALMFASSRSYSEMEGLFPQHGGWWKEDIPLALLASIDAELHGEGSLLALKAQRRKIVPDHRTPYKFPLGDWPRQMKEDWEDLVDYKTVNHKQRPRSPDAQWKSKESIESTLSRTELFAGWCCMPKGQGGGGIDRESLDLTILLDFSLLSTHAFWHKTRNQRNNLGQAIKVFAGQCGSLCRARNAYFYVEANRYMNRPLLADKMPSGEWEEPTEEHSFFAGQVRTLKATRDRYLAYLMVARNGFNTFQNSHKFGGKKLIHPATLEKLQNTDELGLSSLMAAYVRAYRALPSPEATPHLWAVAVRNLVIYALSISHPARSRTTREFELQDLREENGVWHAKVPPERFKAQESGGWYGPIAELFPKHDPVMGCYSMHDLISVFIGKARPILIGTTESNILFPASPQFNRKGQIIGNANRRMTPHNLYRLFRGFTKKYLSTPAATHAMRHIFGTNGVRAGWSFEAIALGLGNTAKMVEKTYESTTALDRGTKATEMIEQLASKKGRK